MALRLNKWTTVTDFSQETMRHPPERQVTFGLTENTTDTHEKLPGTHIRFCREQPAGR